MKIGPGVSELWGVENRPLPLTRPMAYTTACTTVQAVMQAVHNKHLLAESFLEAFQYLLTHLPHFVREPNYHSVDNILHTDENTRLILCVSTLLLNYAVCSACVCHINLTTLTYLCVCVYLILNQPSFHRNHKIFEIIMHLRTKIFKDSTCGAKKLEKKLESRIFTVFLEQEVIHHSISLYSHDEHP